MKVFILLFILEGFHAPLTFAATCSGSPETCVHTQDDETSLVQMKRSLRLGSERSNEDEISPMQGETAAKSSPMQEETAEKFSSNASKQESNYGLRNIRCDPEPCHIDGDQFDFISKMQEFKTKMDFAKKYAAQTVGMIKKTTAVTMANLGYVNDFAQLAADREHGCPNCRSSQNKIRRDEAEFSRSGHILSTVATACMAPCLCDLDYDANSNFLSGLHRALKDNKVMESEFRVRGAVKDRFGYEIDMNKYLAPIPRAPHAWHQRTPIINEPPGMPIHRPHMHAPPIMVPPMTPFTEEEEEEQRGEPPMPPMPPHPHYIRAQGEPHSFPGEPLVMPKPPHPFVYQQGEPNMPAAPPHPFAYQPGEPNIAAMPPHPFPYMAMPAMGEPAIPAMPPHPYAMPAMGEPAVPAMMPHPHAMPAMGEPAIPAMMPHPHAMPAMGEPAIPAMMPHPHAFPAMGEPEIPAMMPHPHAFPAMGGPEIPAMMPHLHASAAMGEPEIPAMMPHPHAYMDGPGEPSIPPMMPHPHSFPVAGEPDIPIIPPHRFPLRVFMREPMFRAEQPEGFADGLRGELSRRNILEHEFGRHALVRDRFGGNIDPSEVWDGGLDNYPDRFPVTVLLKEDSEEVETVITNADDMKTAVQGDENEQTDGNEQGEENEQTQKVAETPKTKAGQRKLLGNVLNKYYKHSLLEEDEVDEDTASEAQDEFEEREQFNGDCNGMTGTLPTQLANTADGVMPDISLRHGLVMTDGHFLPYFSNLRLTEPTGKLHIASWLIETVQMRRAIIWVHGFAANANKFFADGQAVAQANGPTDTLTLAPWFGGTQVTGAFWSSYLEPSALSTNWAQTKTYGVNATTGEMICSGWMLGATSASSAFTSFQIMDRLIQALQNDENFPLMGIITVVGFAAGCEMVSRYSFFSQEFMPSNTKTPVQAIAAECSTYLYLDKTRPHESCRPSTDTGIGHTCVDFEVPTWTRRRSYDSYKYGLSNYTAVDTGALQSLKQDFPKKDVRFLFGSGDYCSCNDPSYVNPPECFITQPSGQKAFPVTGQKSTCCDSAPNVMTGNLFDSTAAAGVQGTNRLQRGMNYVSYLKSAYGTANWPMVGNFTGAHDSAAFGSSSTFVAWAFPISPDPGLQVPR